MSRRREIVDMMKEIQAMPEYQRYNQIRDLGMSEFMFAANYADLETAIKALCGESAPPQMFHMRNRDIQEAAMYHVARYLNNFVAAAVSLVDHTHRLHEKLNEGKGGKPFPEYQERINRTSAMTRSCNLFTVSAITASTIDCQLSS